MLDASSFHVLVMPVLWLVKGRASQTIGRNMMSSFARLCGSTTLVNRICVVPLSKHFSSVALLPAASSHVHLHPFQRHHANRTIPSPHHWRREGHHRNYSFLPPGSSGRHSTVSTALAAISVFLCSNHNDRGTIHWIKHDSNCIHYIDERQFIMAAQNSNLSTLKIFVKGGIDVNTRHPLGWNALHAAVVNGKMDAVKFLVENGADVNAKDEFSSALRVSAQRRVSSAQGTIKFISPCNAPPNVHPR